MGVPEVDSAAVVVLVVAADVDVGVGNISSSWVVEVRDDDISVEGVKVDIKEIEVVEVDVGLVIEGELANLLEDGKIELLEAGLTVEVEADGIILEVLPAEVEARVGPGLGLGLEADVAISVMVSWEWVFGRKPLTSKHIP